MGAWRPNPATDALCQCFSRPPCMSEISGVADTDLRCSQVGAMDGWSAYLRVTGRASPCRLWGHVTSTAHRPGANLVLAGTRVLVGHKQVCLVCATTKFNFR
jgi:hypothetical protein